MPRIRDSKAVKARVKEFQQISLSDPCKSIICGTLLGDGSLQITTGYKNARLSIRHSQSQKEYFLWKDRLGCYRRFVTRQRRTASVYKFKSPIRIVLVKTPPNGWTSGRNYYFKAELLKV